MRTRPSRSGCNLRVLVANPLEIIELHFLQVSGMPLSAQTTRELTSRKCKAGFGNGRLRGWERMDRNRVAGKLA